MVRKMPVKEDFNNMSWDFFAKLILIIYSFLQIIHWPLFPLYMDIYYHLHTAWGFLQSGGYSNWDFWQYAPYGRPHIYPPVFHLVLAFLMKVGLNQVLLAKLFEVILPVLFLITAWSFIRSNYGKRLAFFTLIMLSSSFSFYLSLINHLPSTLALIFGILSLSHLLNKRLKFSLVMLVLCFYTHTGISWFFVVSIIVYALTCSDCRKEAGFVLLWAMVLSVPLIFKQLMDLRYIKVVDLNEKYLSEIKVIDYVFACAGAIVSWRLKGKFRLFVGLLLASFVFFMKPYRFFSAEGFLPVIFLSAVFLNEIYTRLEGGKIQVKYLFLLIIIFFLVVSPTILMKNNGASSRIEPKIYNFDSAVVGLITPERNKRAASSTLWFPNEYIPAADLIRRNSEPDDIIYSSFGNVSVCFASLSGRATSNGLLPDVSPLNYFDPISVSKIIITQRTDDPEWVGSLIKKHNLIRIGENKLFVLYKNPSCYVKARIRKTLISFGMIILIGGVFTFVLLFLETARLKFRGASF